MVQQLKKERREERILLRLNDAGYATRKQLQVMEGLGGDRNAHRILHRMEKDKTINSVRRNQKIYFVSNRGKEVIASNKPKLSNDKMTHTLMRNDIYIKLGMPKKWKAESVIKRSDEVLLIADAMYEDDGSYYFVEVDNVQTMRTNYNKIKKYKTLFNTLFKEQDRPATLIWYSNSEVRMTKIKVECERIGVNYKIY